MTDSQINMLMRAIGAVRSDVTDLCDNIAHLRGDMGEMEKRMLSRILNHEDRIDSLRAKDREHEDAIATGSHDISETQRVLDEQKRELMKTRAVVGSIGLVAGGGLTELVRALADLLR